MRGDDRRARRGDGDHVDAQHHQGDSPQRRQPPTASWPEERAAGGLTTTPSALGRRTGSVKPHISIAHVGTSPRRRSISLTIRRAKEIAPAEVNLSSSVGFRNAGSEGLEVRPALVSTPADPAASIRPGQRRRGAWGRRRDPRRRSWGSDPRRQREHESIEFLALLGDEGEGDGRSPTGRRRYHVEHDEAVVPISGLACDQSTVSSGAEVELTHVSELPQNSWLVRESRTVEPILYILKDG